MNYVTAVLVKQTYLFPLGDSVDERPKEPELWNFIHRHQTPWGLHVPKSIYVATFLGFILIFK